MKKGKSITLLSIIGVIMAAMIVMTFIKFPIGMKNYNSVLGAIETDYDVSGGTAYTLTLSKDNTEPIRDEDIKDVLTTIEYRMDALGYKSYLVKATKNAGESLANFDIRIEAKADTNQYGKPDLTTLSSDIAVVSAYGELEFYGGSEANPTDRVMEDIKVVKDAYYAGMQSNGQETYYFSTTIEFTDDAMDYIDTKLAAGDFYLEVKLGDNVLLQGSEKLTKDYFVKNALSLSTSASSPDEDTIAQMEASSKQTALQIKSGGLAYKFDISEGVQVSSPYGENTALVCIIAVAALLIGCILMNVVLYRGFGVIAGLSMLLFIMIELSMLIAVPNIVVSLGGVIGIALSTILCADGMFITGKRLKEELANKKTVKASFNTAFKRSLVPIINSTIISAIVAGALLIFGNGILYSFAVTFGIGTVVSIVSTLVFTRMFAGLIVPLAKNKDGFFKSSKVED